MSANMQYHLVSAKKSVLLVLLTYVAISAFNHLIKSDSSYDKMMKSIRFLPYGENERCVKNNIVQVGIGGGITSAGLNETFSILDFPLLRTFLPSFCETCSLGISYHFYFAYDFTDMFFSDEIKRNTLITKWQNTVKALCPETINVSLTLLECNYSKKPAWAQNDAMVEAYLDGMDYMYRINDDTKLITKNWSMIFIDRLAKMNPPNVGVVGPNHNVGVGYILTYEFVHQTHYNIFGYHYPRIYTGWSADRWITVVYGNKTEKVKEVEILHEKSLGTRYPHHKTIRKPALTKVYKKAKRQIARYVETMSSNLAQRSDRTIIYSVDGGNRNDTLGLLRNLQIAKSAFPEWNIQIYTPMQRNNNPADDRIFNKIQCLGAHIHFLNTSQERFNFDSIFSNVSFEKGIDVVLWRYPMLHLTVKEKQIVDEWIDSYETCQCIHYNDIIVNATRTDILYGIKMGRLSQAKMGTETSSLRPMTFRDLLKLANCPTDCN